VTPQDHILEASNQENLSSRKQGKASRSHARVQKEMDESHLR